MQSVWKEPLSYSRNITVSLCDLGQGHLILRALNSLVKIENGSTELASKFEQI